MIISSGVKKKIILLLLAGTVLGLVTSPRAQKRIFRALQREWRFVNKQNLYRNIKKLEEQEMVRYKNKGEWWNIELTEKGKKQAQKIGFNRLKISKPKKWDKKWRIFMFDVPERKRIIRDALRKKIQNLGFKEIQKSVFIYPFSCHREMDIVVDFFKAEKFVKQFTVVDIYNTTDKKLRKKFDL